MIIYPTTLVFICTNQALVTKFDAVMVKKHLTVGLADNAR